MQIKRLLLTVIAMTASDSLAHGEALGRRHVPPPPRRHLSPRAACKWNGLVKMIGDDWNDRFGKSIDLSGAGSEIIIGAMDYSPSSKIKGPGHAKVFKVPEGQLIGRKFYGSRPEQLGYSVAMSSDGNVVALGAPHTGGSYSDHGTVKVYRRNNNNNWVQLGKTISGSKYDVLGSGVSLSGDGMTVAVGALQSNWQKYGNGYARVFQLDQDSNTWVPKGRKIKGDTQRSSKGLSVSLSEDGLTLAVGAPTNGQSNNGDASVYTFMDGDWARLGNAITGGSGYWTGFSVALSGDGLTLAVGSPSGNMAQVFRLEGDEWTLIGKTMKGEQNYHAGASVSLSHNGKIFAVGSPGGFTGSKAKVDGYTMVYELSEENDWIPLGDKIECGGSYRCGISVALSSDGSILAEGADYDKGRVRVFGLECSPPPPPTPPPPAECSKATTCMDCLRIDGCKAWHELGYCFESLDHCDRPYRPGSVGSHRTCITKVENSHAGDSSMTCANGSKGSCENIWYKAGCPSSKPKLGTECDTLIEWCPCYYPELDSNCFISCDWGDNFYKEWCFTEDGVVVNKGGEDPDPEPSLSPEGMPEDTNADPQPSPASLRAKEPSGGAFELSAEVAHVLGIIGALLAYQVATTL